MSLGNNPLTVVTDPVAPWSSPYLGLPALALVAVVLAGLTLITYAGSPRATGRRVSLLVLLRLAALLLAFLALLRPSVAFRDDLYVPSTLLLALDGSESMTIQDEISGQSRWAAVLRTLDRCRPVLQKLRDENNVNVVLYRFADDVRDFDPEGKADGPRTDFGELLHALYDRHRAEPHLRGLIILSDGADNGTRYQPLPLAAQWRSLPCPVSTVAFGKPTTSDKQSDIAVTAINPEPSPVPVKGELTVKATIDAPGFENSTVRVMVYFDDQKDHPAGTEDVMLALTTDNQVKVKCTAPDKPGEIKVTLRVQELPGELSKANNEMSTYLTVTKEGVSVLLVDKERVWEPQMICDALRLDPRIRLYTAWLRGNQALTPGQVDLFQFDKQRYDVILLGDVPADRLREGNANALASIYRLVDEKGSGLLMYGGYASFGHSWRHTPVEQLLPVRLAEDSEQAGGPVRMVPNEAGLRHYVLRLADNPADNKALWERLPPLNGRTKLGEVKPGGIVLAAVGEAAGPPLLVAQTHGAGRVLAFGGDSTERWRIDEAGVRAHARFWKQLVLWLAKQEEVEGSVWVKPDTRRLAAGGKLGFSVGVRGKGGLDLKDARFEAHVVGPKDLKAPVPTARDKDEDRGTFWKTDAPGEYRLVVTGKAKDTDGQEVTGEATARFLVYQDEAEMVRRAADHDFLKRLASTGGGEFLRPEELEGFLDKLRSQPIVENRPKTNTWPEWKGNQTSGFLVTYLLLFVGLLSLEWLLRRRWGLV